MVPVHSRLALVVALAAAVAALPASAEAQKKKKKAKVKPACGLKVLPFAEGTEWTYQYFVPEGVQLPPGVRIQDPPSMTVKVVKVTTEKGKSRISLEESYRKVVVKTELECDKTGLNVPPDSFFFAGQPGGGILMKLDKIERKAEINIFEKGGLKGEAFEELKAVATREPSPGTGAVMTPAKLEIERKMVVGAKETVESAITSHKATRVTINMTGRATLDTTPDKPLNMPQFDVAMWFEPDVGVVQVRNSLGQGWKLSEHKTAADE
jgi:hypothetical protein